MKLHQLRTILAVAEKGSLRAAARHLGASQPALTHSIRELEKDLGATLFERTAQGMVPTPVGEILLRRACVIERELDHAREEIRQVQGGQEGSVVVCASMVAHFTIVTRALPLFSSRYPHVRLRIIEGPFPLIESKLQDGTADFYVGLAPDEESPKDLLTEKLFDNTRAVFARKCHPLGRATTLAELANAGWMTTGLGDNMELELAQLFAKHGFAPPKIVVQSESLLTTLMALISTDLLAVTARQLIEWPLGTETLQVIDIKETIVAPSVVLIRPKRSRLTPAAEYLCRMLREASNGYTRGGT